MKEKLRNLLRSFQDRNKNGDELVAFLTENGEFVKRSNIGRNKQLEPIRRLLDFTKAITAFGNKLMCSSPDSLPLPCAAVPSMSFAARSLHSALLRPRYASR